MKAQGKTAEQWAREVEELRSQLEAAEETLRAIREGEVDSQLIANPAGAAERLAQANEKLLQELTERKRAEEALRQNQEDLDRAQAVGQIGSWRLDFGRNVLMWSDETYRIFDIPQGTPLSYETFLVNIHPDDRQYVDARWQAALTGESYDIEHRIMVGGQVKWVREKAYLEFDDAGKLIGGFGITQDITERKQVEEALRNSERLYRAIGESIDYGVWVCTPDGRNIYASESFLKLVGLTQEQCSDFGWGDILHPDDAQNTIAAWKECARTGGTWDIEHRFRGVDGQWHPILARGVPVRDEKGKITCWAGINLDISRLKEAEQTLRDADRRKDEFLAMLAHELRNPLAPIRNAVHVLRLTGSHEPTSVRQKDIIDRQVTHMARLLDDLLDVSRITRGTFELHKQPLHLADAIVHAIETSTPLIEARRHTLSVTFPPDDLRLEGDLDRLSQIVNNLLVNAAKYTDEGGQIWLEAACEDGQAVIRVRDTGMGIDPEMLPRIFEMFTQADQGLARSRGGLGIGLTMVKKLVEMHGGTVEACSGGAGQGSEFTVRLPAFPCMAQSPVRAAKPVEGEPETTPCRILVVDDVIDTSESFAELLGLWGHEIRMVHDGSAALTIARSFRPDVVLLDIGLPGMDGYEVARRLRQEHADRPMRLVALTGYGQESDRQQAREAGFDHHLVKPVDLGILHKLLIRPVPSGT